MLKTLPWRFTPDLLRVQTRAHFSSAQPRWHLQCLPRLGGLIVVSVLGLNLLPHHPTLATFSAALHS